MSAFEGCNELSFFLVESDSLDESVLVLSQLSSIYPEFNYVSMGCISSMYPSRTQRIAYCRNIYLDYFRNHAKYDYLVVADLDGANNRLTKQGVLSCWNSPYRWDVCCANQLGPYYDIYALRHPIWCPTDCWKQQAFLQSHGMSKYKSSMVSVYDKMLTIDQSSPWIEVESAFGGLAIYKCSIINQSSYSGVCPESNDDICEHVPFHASLRNNGAKIFINPMLINQYSNSSTNLSFSNF